MDFYSIWEGVRSLQMDDSEFLKCFLLCSEASLTPLKSGSRDEVENAAKFLGNIPYSEFLQAIKALEPDDDLIPAEVPCFSTFNNGVVRLNELLEFAPNGLTYADIGYQITNAPNQLAQIKYGENHAKLAAMMSLVAIDSHHRPINVTSTSLGRYLTRYTLDGKAPLLRRLIIRDHCVRKIIYSALHGGANYRSIVINLKDSTAYRRRTSVKCAVDFALDTPEALELGAKINWEL